MQVLQEFDGRGEQMGQMGSVEVLMLPLAVVAAVVAAAAEDWLQNLTLLLQELQEIRWRGWNYG